MSGATRRRVVVKVGSQVLCDPRGELDVDVLEALVAQTAALAEGGWEVLLVSSGAVAAGSGLLGAHARRLGNPVIRKQVLAATGQVRLMDTYHRLFERHGIAVAQVLASKSDFQTRQHYLNMRACIEALLAAGVVPVVNENDVVSVTELMFTDNDELAGLLAGMVNAERLCILSAVPGVLERGPGGEPASVIACWDESRYSVEDVVRAGASRLGRGGMHSKLEVALKVSGLGVEVHIADGRAQDILTRIAAGEEAGTRFPARGRATPAKRWLATMDDHALGSVTVNPGAEQALRDRSRLASLLPVGVEHLAGDFQRGDVILVRNTEGRVLGCGRAQYDRDEAEAIKGQRGHKPLIHYDYLYLID